MTLPPPEPPPREASLDLARGLAVVGMIYVHLVPMEGSATGFQRLATGLARLLEGRSAALFCVLAGVAWAIQAGRVGDRQTFSRYLLRRAAFLVAVGAAFHVLLWPTEILLPLALMMPLSLLLRRGGSRVLVGATVLLAAASPLLVLAAQGQAEPPDGPGFHGVLAFFFVDGHYPLLPWLAFPLLGMVAWQRGWLGPDRVRRSFGLCLALTALVEAGIAWNATHLSGPGPWAPQLARTWTPASLPFLLSNGGGALVLLTGLAWWPQARSGSWWTRPIAQLGRASLTHYLLHVGVVFLPLRFAYPADDWPPHVGLTGFALYLGLAVPLTGLWFRRFPRGPLESLWAWASGTPR